MKTFTTIFLSLTLSTAFAATGTLDFSFKTKTNVPGVKIDGKLKKPVSFDAATGSVVKVPLKALVTGIEKRDEHMRMEVFQSKDPILTIVRVDQCQSNKDCAVPVKFNLAGTEKEIEVKLTSKGGGKYEGEKTLKLSDFKIPQPAKMGVKVDNEVIVNFKVSVK